MKAALFVTLSATLLGGCGSDSPAGLSGGTPQCLGSALSGTWNRQDVADLLTLTTACTGTSVYCGQSFSFTAPSGAGGDSTVQIQTSNNNAGCLPAGAYNCTFATNGTQLNLNCGAGTVVYTR